MKRKKFNHSVYKARDSSLYITFFRKNFNIFILIFGLIIIITLCDVM